MTGVVRGWRTVDADWRRERQRERGNWVSGKREKLSVSVVVLERRRAASTRAGGRVSYVHVELGWRHPRNAHVSINSLNFSWNLEFSDSQGDEGNEAELPLEKPKLSRFTNIIISWGHCKKGGFNPTFVNHMSFPLNKHDARVTLSNSWLVFGVQNYFVQRIYWTMNVTLLHSSIYREALIEFNSENLLIVIVCRNAIEKSFSLYSP